MENGKKLREEEVFEVKLTPLFYTQAINHYHNNPWNERREHTIVVEQVLH